MKTGSIIAFILISTAYAFPSPARSKGNSLRKHNAAVVESSLDVNLVSPDLTGVTEPACIDTAKRMQIQDIPVPTFVHPEGKVGISYVFWPAEQRSASKLPPLVLVHGFDSSCLEYRRLGSRLADRGINTYAVDLLGWGFTQLDGVSSFSAEAKTAALRSFIETVVPGTGYVLGGASLGGAAAIETVAAALRDSPKSSNKVCQGLVLIDAQGFVDGIGPMANLPSTLAGLGVQVLKSVPLRRSANQMSYFDKETYATEEAVVIGRLHCTRDGWSEAMVSFMKSGGFSPSSKVPTIDVPSLVLWGRQDGILDGEELVPKFMEALPQGSMEWIEECGHVPHLEQPNRTADAIRNFLDMFAKSNRQKQDSTGTSVNYRLVAVGVGAATVAGTVLANVH